MGKTTDSTLEVRSLNAGSSYIIAKNHCSLCERKIPLSISDSDSLSYRSLHGMPLLVRSRSLLKSQINLVLLFFK